ncbi:hypothetical protein NDS46_31225 (plasmid) [Paenibacillus thiaminolyticus]|uniref:hypothetical protein n=1 Tax=Paenibacillus thiaminolyticus TaxID=49283 RepID=UPI00233101EF|nr:hypothetical protein [Paenibacillus thiaminolyticus]WCF11431.1 hypothetical protein NDS46_31225 [Paenibacillus thiaminolyticus]
MITWGSEVEVIMGKEMGCRGIVEGVSPELNFFDVLLIEKGIIMQFADFELKQLCNQNEK